MLLAMCELSFEIVHVGQELCSRVLIQRYTINAETMIDGILEIWHSNEGLCTLSNHISFVEAQNSAL
jgi:hypothetical protein